MISELTANINAGKLSASSCVGPIKELNNFGCLASDVGMQLISTLKGLVMKNLTDLDDFETLANLVDALPKCFAKSELEMVRIAYSAFTDKYGKSCGLSNPDELREEASRVGDVGDLLEVDTKSAQDSLRESADEIESEEPETPDDDGVNHPLDAGDSEVLSDLELDSMFGTLCG